MKRIISALVIITIFLILLPQAMADLNDGMVAYWPFSGSANDAGGNGHHGTVFGPTLTVDRFGNSACAYSFDGVNDYIDIPYSPSIEPSVFSLSIWLKSLTSSQSPSTLWSTDPNIFSCNHGYAIILSGTNAFPGWPVAPNGTPQFYIDPTASCGDGRIISGDSSLNDGTWHHMVAIYNGSTLKLYVDGILQQETSNSKYSKTGASIRIGMWRRANGFYQGSIDDIRLYNRVLSKLEILDLFNENCGFVDVPPGYWAEDAICTIYDEGITTGCSKKPLKYCPENDVTRAQMAIFLGRGIHGSSFTPPPATGIFDDVSVSYWAAAWIEQFYKDGITTGCKKNPLMYCPGADVTRAQMAIFLLRSKYGKNYKPPKATGVFTDVPVTYWAAAWIEQLYKEGITTGCQKNPLRYCPESSVTRAQMAVFIVRTFFRSVACSDNTDCPSSSYCAKAIGDCDGKGICQERPEICTPIYIPVCGCDGKTYSNACAAAAAGINVDYEGECL